MTGAWGWDLLIGVTVALLVTWLALIVTLAIVRPRGGLLREALRLLPDVLRLVRRLATDPDLRVAYVMMDGGALAAGAVSESGSRCCWPTWPSPSTWCPTSSPSSATPTTPSSSPSSCARWCAAPG